MGDDSAKKVTNEFDRVTEAGTERTDEVTPFRPTFAGADMRSIDGSMFVDAGGLGRVKVLIGR